MRYLITSDWHIDSRLAGVQRIDEIRGVVSHLAEESRRQDVDVIINCGDFFDPCTPRDLFWATELIRLVRQLHDAAKQGSIWIAGNHDTVQDSWGQTTLSPLAAVADLLPGLHIVEDPTWIPGFNTLAIPHPRAGRRVHGARLDDAVALAQPGCIVAAHLIVPGALLGSESREMSRGRDETLDAATITALDPCIVLNGHYHKPQVVAGPTPIQIPGALIRHTFGEAGNDPRYLLIDTENEHI